MLTDLMTHNGIHYPQTEEEVVRLVHFARKHQFTIRTLGSQHSPSQAICSQASNEIRIILDGRLKRISTLNYLSNNRALVSVGAGCHLGFDPSDPDSTLENSFNYQLDQKGFALPTLGGISHQTIGGFLQTSSSGGTAKYGIADAIISMRIVNGLGNVLVLHQGEDLFNAAGVAMGLFGIIIEVTFECIRKFFVIGKEENKSIDDSLLAKNSMGQYGNLDQAFFHDYDYIHLNWFLQNNVPHNRNF